MKTFEEFETRVTSKLIKSMGWSEGMRAVDISSRGGAFEEYYSIGPARQLLPGTKKWTDRNALLLARSIEAQIALDNELLASASCLTWSFGLDTTGRTASSIDDCPDSPMSAKAGAHEF